VTTSRVPAVLDYLVTTFNAAATLGAAAAPNTVLIFDGPVTGLTSAPLVLWVGMDDPDGTGGRRGAVSTQDWAGLGHQARNEFITIHCAADAWTGVDDTRTARLLAYAITSAVEDIVRNDATLGGTVSVPGNAAVTAGELWQDNTDRGALARVMFDITAQARIGG
jgi:hypothetical protein